MASIATQYRAKRVYEITSPEGRRQLRLSDRIVELGEGEFDWYQKVAAWLPSVRDVADLSRELGMDEAKLPKFIKALEKSGLLYRVDDAPKMMTGLEFHRRCSAVLEGTTTNRKTYNPYYEKSAELYGIPKEAIAPIYQHLDLDVQYQHSDLFKDILGHVPEISAERASVILDYGHQLVEHIWQWTENIEKYYRVE